MAIHAVANAASVTTNFELLARHIRRLQWLQVIGLNDEELLGVLEPVVRNAIDSPTNSRKGLRTKISEYRLFTGWRNATLWWGLPGEEAPCEMPAYEGNKRIRSQLFRIVDGDNDNVVIVPGTRSYAIIQFLV